MLRLRVAFGLAAVLAASAAALRADDTPQPPVAKPGPQHAILNKSAGVWDATVETTMPDGTKSSSTGVETNKMICNGLWQVSDFKGSFGGQPFEGHGVNGWDAAKKKYVGTWIDSMSSSLSVVEQTYDAATKTMSGTMEGPDETGKAVKIKMVTIQPDDNNRVFTMSMPGPDGKEMALMKIVYKRRSK